MITKIITFFFITTTLIGLFLSQEHHIDTQPKTLAKSLPTVMYKVLFGYLKHVSAEYEFIRTSIFIGDRESSLANNVESLAYNYEVMTSLYPQFIDPYYFCQATIPHIAPEYAQKASDILMHGYKYYPDQLILPFFASFNYFYHMHNNKVAAEILLELSQKEGAPSWFGHFAATLSAKDGDLRGGLFALQVMAQSTEGEEQARYQQNIVYFSNALQVSEATKTYMNKYNRAPNDLNDLIPEFLDALPDVGQNFRLEWDGERVTLQRPKS